MAGPLLPSEIQAKWAHAFERWFLSSDLSRVIELLNDGIPMSERNTRFLGAILAKNIRPLSAKRSRLFQFKQNVIDNTIADLRNRGMSREKIREELIRKELVDASLFSIAALNRRMDKKKPSFIDTYQKAVEDFVKLYDAYL